MKKSQTTKEKYLIIRSLIRKYKRYHKEQTNPPPTLPLIWWMGKNCKLSEANMNSVRVPISFITKIKEDLFNQSFEDSLLSSTTKYKLEQYILKKK